MPSSLGNCPAAQNIAFQGETGAVFSSSVGGSVPASGGGTTNFLRADVTWAAPPAGGSPPTGTGFRHITGGVEDAASEKVTFSDADQVTPNQGTVTTLLHGNAAGQPSFGAVVTADITDDNVTYAKIQNVSATSRLLGRITAGVGDIEELTGTQATTLLDAFTSALKGLAPASGGGTTNFLRADATWAAPGGGSDPWTYKKLAANFLTSSASAVTVVGLSFAPAAGNDYEFQAQLMLRTNAALTNPRLGLGWATGLSDGVAVIQESQAATGTPLFASGNTNAALLIAVGGLPNTTQSWPARIDGFIRTGASPGGAMNVQLASETAGTTVTIVAGSYLAYRII